MRTPHGNVLWDLVTVLDDGAREFLEEQGGVAAIVISHPHYYGAHRDWAAQLRCPVYLAIEDREWLSFDEEGGDYRWIEGATETILPGVTAIKVGGHFPGSLCLHVAGADGGRLLVADSLVTVPSAKGPFAHPPKGVASYAFMWSIPNMVFTMLDATRQATVLIYLDRSRCRRTR